MAEEKSQKKTAITMARVYPLRLLAKLLKRGHYRDKEAISILSGIPSDKDHDKVEEVQKMENARAHSHFLSPQFFKAAKKVVRQVQAQLAYSIKHGCSSSPSPQLVLPPKGWLKINTDASVVNGVAAVAIVVRDDSGDLVLVASKLINICPPFKAELEAVNWATELAERRQWRKVVWTTANNDVASKLNTVPFETDSSSHTSHKVNTIIRRAANKIWRFEWMARETNSFADLVAKQTTEHLQSCYFDENNLHQLPSAFAIIAHTEKMGCFNQ